MSSSLKTLPPIAFYFLKGRIQVTFLHLNEWKCLPTALSRVIATCSHSNFYHATDSRASESKANSSSGPNHSYCLSSRVQPFEPESFQTRCKAGTLRRHPIT